MHPRAANSSHLVLVVVGIHNTPHSRASYDTYSANPIPPAEHPVMRTTFSVPAKVTDIVEL